MATKRRFLWLGLTAFVSYLAYALAVRRFYAELAAIRGEMEAHNELINTMVDGVQTRLKVHG